MLHQDVCTNNNVNVSNYANNIIQGFLDYIYNGYTNVLEDHEKVPELLNFARQFDFEKLKEDCEDVIRRIINIPATDTCLNDDCIRNDIRDVNGVRRSA